MVAINFILKIHMNKRNIALIISSLVLSVIAVVTGIKLYQLRQQSIAPTKPKAVTEKCTLEFTVSIPTPTPTLTVTPTGTITPTLTGTPTPTPTLTVTPTGTLTPTVTSTPPTSTPAPGEPTVTPAPPTELPSAGGILPTIGIIVGGTILGILGLLLAL